MWRFLGEHEGPVLTNRGSVNYCVRWDSSATVTAAQRDQIHATLARQYKKWMDELVDPTGVGGFPMKAGTSASITEFDAWMFRDWWQHLKSRHGY